MSTHIQIRRGSEIAPGEEPRVGEGFWTPEGSRFGVFNGVTNKIEWYPITREDLLLLNQNQFLSGITAGGGRNHVLVDWGTPDEIIFRNSETGTVLLRITESATYLHNPTTGSTAEVGISNRALNGNLSVPFRVALPTYPVVATEVGSIPVMPNWLLWKRPGSSGQMSVQFDTTDVPSGCDRCFLVNCLGAPNASGLRSYIHDYGTVRNREMVMSAAIKGPSGRSMQMRVVNSAGEIARKPFVMSGIWQNIYIDFTVPDVAGGYLGMDFVYSPSNADPALLQFRAGKFGAYLGRTPPRYESRSSELERSLLRGIYKDGSVFVQDTAYGTIDLGLNAGSGIDVVATSTGGTTTVSSTNSLGAAVRIASGTGLNRIDYRAVSVIRTAETA